MTMRSCKKQRYDWVGCLVQMPLLQTVQTMLMRSLRNARRLMMIHRLCVFLLYCHTFAASCPVDVVQYIGTDCKLYRAGSKPHPQAQLWMKVARQMLPLADLLPHS